MIVRDWRDLDAAMVGELYNAERAQWTERLCWDAQPSLAIIEAGRSAGHVPGFVAFDDRGRVAGWIYFFLHDGALQIGGISARRPAVIRALLESVLSSPEAGLARTLSCVALLDAQGLDSALTRLRFRLTETLYLARPNAADADAPRHPAITSPWHENDLPSIVRLVETAYRGTPGAEHFAPQGRREEWVRYVAQLVYTPACGVFDPSLSFVVRGETGRLDGAILTTRIGPAAAHVAQLVVAPEVRGRDLARALVARATAAAASASLPLTTLMVDSRNTDACRLYDRLGFERRARLICGQRAAPTRTSARCA